MIQTSEAYDSGGRIYGCDLATCGRLCEKRLRLQPCKDTEDND